MFVFGDLSSHDHAQSPAALLLFSSRNIVFIMRRCYFFQDCNKNGKKYKEGETFTIGHLHYKCQKYGVYSIEGAAASILLISVNLPHLHSIDVLRAMKQNCGTSGEMSLPQVAANV